MRSACDRIRSHEVSSGRRRALIAITRVSAGQRVRNPVVEDRIETVDLSITNKPVFSKYLYENNMITKVAY